MSEHWRQMQEADYHADPALGSTDIKNLLRSPAHFLSAKTAGFESEALRIGSLVHECILDPDLWARRRTAPSVDRRTKAGKAAAAEFAAMVQAEGLSEVSEADRALCEAMRQSALSHRLVRAVLEHAEKREHSCFWQTDGIACKARLDALADGLVMDLKTTQDATASAFRSSVARYRYHVQAAHYSAGVHAVTGQWPDFAFVAIEKTPPFACAVYILDEDALSLGTDLRERALQRYAECMERDEWPAYPETTQTLSLPPWAAAEEWT